MAWNPVYSVNYGGQSTGVPPIGTTERLRTDGVTYVVEEELGFDADRRFRIATDGSSPAADRLRSIDDLDGEANTRQRIVVRFDAIPSNPLIFDFRMSGNTDAGNQDSTLTGYSLVVVPDVPNAGDASINLFRYNSGSLTALVATFGGAVQTTTDVVTQLSVGDILTFDVQIIADTIEYKFWHDTDPEPTVQGPGYIIFADASPVASGSWNGFGGRGGNAQVSVDTAEAFVWLPEDVNTGMVKTYEAANHNIARGLLAGTPNIRLTLHDSTSNANDLASPAELGDITGELPTANGYTQGGVLLANPTLTRDGDTAVLAADDFGAGNPYLTASGGPVVSHYYVYSVDGSFNGLTNPVLGVQLADIQDQDITVPNGEDLTIEGIVNGILSFEGAYAD